MILFFAILFWVSFIALFWTYFGYPLLMFTRARYQPKPVHTSNSLPLPSLTLLIPAYNEADVIRRKLENSVSLTYPSGLLQILVVDDGSDDSTSDIVREYADRGATLLQQPSRSGKMAAVNAGFAHATGDIVVLSDASPHYEEDALRNLVRPFADPMIGVVVGTLALWDAATAVAKPAGLYWKYEAALRKWESRTGSTVAVHGNMFAIRRALYHPLQSDTINDEFSIAMETMRQGYRVIYEPEAMSYDDASKNMRDEFSRRVRINAGRYQALFSAGYLRFANPDITFRLFSHKLLRPLTPIFMLLMLIANLFVLLLNSNPTRHFWQNLLMLQGGWGTLLLVGQLIFYALAGSGWLAERRGIRSRFLNVPYYFVSANLAALLGLWRWLRGSQRVTWQKRTTER